MWYVAPLSRVLLLKTYDVESLARKNTNMWHPLPFYVYSSTKVASNTYTTTCVQAKVGNGNAETTTQIIPQRAKVGNGNARTTR